MFMQEHQAARVEENNIGNFCFEKSFLEKKFLMFKFNRKSLKCTRFFNGKYVKK
jgi:hypothetical protein